jgi:hypothetical protein
LIEVDIEVRARIGIHLRRISIDESLHDRRHGVTTFAAQGPGRRIAMRSTQIRQDADAAGKHR